MKILLINTTDTDGGAAIAAVRLLNELNNQGIYARLGVKKKKSDNSYVFELPRKKISFVRKIIKVLVQIYEKIYKKILLKLPNPFRFKTTNEILHSENKSSEIDLNWINNSDFDVINLHWICNTISIKQIGQLTKPIVWTMHDTWPFCGAEHYPNILEHDERYKFPYTKNNKPKTTKGIDICKRVWLQKKKYLSKKNIFFVSPSNWEAACLKQSSLFSKNKCNVIHNIIPKTLFYKMNKKEIRELLQIPADKMILGFGAEYGINNPRGVKGSYYLLQALNKLPNKNKYHIIIFGDAREEFTSKISINYTNMGFVSNPLILSLFYNVCDVFVCPSIVENLPNTCLEALFCGVPSVAFNSGGTEDIIENNKTGYLAEPFNIDDLTKGIELVSQNSKLLSNNCIEKAKNDFDAKKIINEYLKVYKEAVN